MAIFADVKIRGAYLLLDPQYPAARLDYMLADSQAPVIVTESSLREALPTSGSVMLCVDVAREALAQESRRAPLAPVQQDDLAYVIYTSGSTGRPRECCLTHGGASNLALMIDNVAVAHARGPYSGDRRVYATLGRFKRDAEYLTSAASSSS